MDEMKMDENNGEFIIKNFFDKIIEMNLFYIKV
jgi:hypothetical protein